MYLFALLALRIIISLFTCCYTFDSCSSIIKRLTHATFSCRFLSIKLGRQFDHVAETLLPPLLSLLQNSAKVMSTSGSVCLTIILKVCALIVLNKSTFLG